MSAGRIQNDGAQANHADETPSPEAIENSTVLSTVNAPPQGVPSAPLPLELPVAWGEYELLEKLGHGGMGVVYKARQRTTDRLVALKLIRPDRQSQFDPEERAELQLRFHNEVHAAARLEHDHVVSIFDMGEAGGQLFYAMRYVEGQSLLNLVTKQPLEPEAAARYAAQVASALTQAHAIGIFHRDVKPHNILIDRKTDRALLTDFGLAKLADGNQGLTATTAILGSPPYISPEQTTGAAQVTAATDIYGLGATLYHALTGRPPFQAATATATMLLVQTQEPVRPRALNPALPRDLETICLKCLEKDPLKRYRSAEELGADLNRFLNGEPVLARPLGVLGRVWRWYHRTPHAPIAAAGGLTVFFAVLLVFWSFAGIVFYATGLHPSPQPFRSIVELALLVLSVYVPMFWCGVRTLNGHIGSLLVTAVISTVFFVLTLGLTFAQPWGMSDWEIMKDTIADVGWRLQFGSLLSLLAGGCVAVHIMAIRAWLVSRGSQAGRLSTSGR